MLTACLQGWIHNLTVPFPPAAAAPSPWLNPGALYLVQLLLLAGMVQFLMARLGGGSTTRAATTAAGVTGAAPPGGLEDANLALRFAAAVAANGTPVLIVHGAGDKLVPASNSFKLARLIKGCRLAVVKRAGHCPQEEVPGVFEEVVCSFLGKSLA